MIAGIEGIHSWTPPGEADPVISLGLTHDLDTGVEIWPHYRLKKITGLGSLADAQDNRDNRVGADGEIPRLSRRRGKTVVYEGKLEARSLREMREAESNLRQAFADLSGEGKMTAIWHPDNTDFDDLGERYFNARALTVDVVDTQETQRFFRSFVVSVRMSKSTYFDQDDVAYF